MTVFFVIKNLTKINIKMEENCKLPIKTILHTTANITKNQLISQPLLNLCFKSTFSSS